MKKRLTHISPLQCGIVLAALYLCISLLFIPFFLLGAMAAAHAPQNANGGNPFAAFGLVFVILFPVLYSVIGFIGGIIVALIYNLIAKMTGGIEFITVDAPPALPSAAVYPAN